jgi:hypothetical protein
MRGASKTKPKVVDTVEGYDDFLVDVSATKTREAFVTLSLGNKRSVAREVCSPASRLFNSMVNPVQAVVLPKLKAAAANASPTNAAANKDGGAAPKRKDPFASDDDNDAPSGGGAEPATKRPRNEGDSDEEEDDESQRAVRPDSCLAFVITTRLRIAA